MMGPEGLAAVDSPPELQKRSSGVSVGITQGTTLAAIPFALERGRQGFPPLGRCWRRGFPGGGASLEAGSGQPWGSGPDCHPRVIL